MNNHKKAAPKLRFKGFNDDWEQRKLSDITDSIGTGKSSFIKHGKSDYNPYAILGSTSIIGYDSEFDHEGDFILTARVGANAGNLYRYYGKAKITDNTVFIKGENLSFLYHLLNHFDLKKLAFGTGQPLVKASELKNLLMKTPSLEEQTQIGNLFKHMDDTIALYQQKLDKLKELKSAYLDHIFNQKIRFLGFTGEWEQRKLGDVVNITMGQSPNGENYTNNPENYILVQGNADINNGWVEPRVWTTQVTKLADKGDIIITVRAPVGDVGKTNFDIVLGRGVAGIKGNEFIFQMLSKMKSDGFWTRYSSGSTFESINSFDLKDAKINVPVEAEQTKIGNLFKVLDEYIVLHDEKLIKLKELKKAYLQKMFV